MIILLLPSKFQVLIKHYLLPVCSQVHVKLCLHLARQSLSAVVRRTLSHHQVTMSSLASLTVLTISEEPGVPLGQLEPGLQDHGQPGLVELSAGLD